jgi:N-acetylmuramoyl-L-alanine amidase
MTVTIKNHRIEGVEYIASPNVGGEIQPRFVVEHYTAGYTAESAIAALTRKGSGVSAHVVVDLDGTVTQLVPFNIKAWHAGPSSHMGYSGLNSHSVGIEIVNIGFLRRVNATQYQDAYGNTRNDTDFPHGLIEAPNARVGSGSFFWPRYTPEQLQVVDELTAALIDKYNIIDVVSHEEIDTRGWKTDPGPAFPMKLMRRHLANDRGDDGVSYVVLPGTLNMRGGPGTTFAVNGTLTKGKIVEVVEQRGDWGRIDDESWVHMSFIRRV